MGNRLSDPLARSCYQSPFAGEVEQRRSFAFHRQCLIILLFSAQAIPDRINRPRLALSPKKRILTSLVEYL
jgi:hypothetical protein